MKTNNKIPDEDLAWLQAQKNSVERRDRMLKGTGMFFYCFALFFALISFIVLATHYAFFYASISFIIFLGLSAILIIADPPYKYAGDEFAGIMSGLIVGLIIAIVYIAPTASISQYPVSMQVFYPNHPNITITQNCTGFTTSASGYFNGQPINPTNTTQCNLPASMIDNYGIKPFNCNITGKNITCSTSLLNRASLLGASTNITWKGTILNVSKR